MVGEIHEIAKGSFKYRQPPEIKGTGYVVKSLEAALWAFEHSSSFREGCLLAVNLGDGIWAPNDKFFERSNTLSPTSNSSSRRLGSC